MAQRREQGLATERRTLDYLQRQGLRLVTSNYRCRTGEIDLIMKESDTLVLVEVRQRSHSYYDGALARVDAAKQRHLIATARHYLQKNGSDAFSADPG